MPSTPAPCSPPPAQIDRAEAGGVDLVLAEAVTGSYFPMLGIEAALGRTLLPSDDVSRDGHRVAMLDYRYRQCAFGGDPDVVGRRMRVGGRDLHGDRGRARRIRGHRAQPHASVLRPERDGRGAQPIPHGR